MNSFPLVMLCLTNCLKMVVVVLVVVVVVVRMHK